MNRVTADKIPNMESSVYFFNGAASLRARMTSPQGLAGPLYTTHSFCIYNNKLLVKRHRPKVVLLIRVGELYPSLPPTNIIENKCLDIENNEFGKSRKYDLKNHKKLNLTKIDKNFLISIICYFGLVENKFKNSIEERDMRSI